MFTGMARQSRAERWMLVIGTLAMSLVVPASAAQAGSVAKEGPPTAGVAASIAPPGSPIMTKDECYRYQGSSTAKGYVRDHYSWCRWGTKVVGLDAGRGSSAVTVWAVSFRYTIVGSGSKGSRDTLFRVWLDDFRRPEGYLVASDPAVGNFEVYSRCLYMCTDSGGANLNGAVWNGGAHTDLIVNSTDQGDGIEKRATFWPEIKIIARSPLAPGKMATMAFESTTVRCDSAQYMATKKACIFSNVVSFITFDRKDSTIREAAEHYWDAYNNVGATVPKAAKTIPGKYGSNTFLFRIPKGLKAANHTAAVRACVRFFGKQYTLKNGVRYYDCDEFPFQSTWQGVKYAGTNYSVRPVYWRHNQRAGTNLGNWFERDRILYNDRFQIKVI